MSKRVLFIDDGDGTELELLPSGLAPGGVRIAVSNFAGPGQEAAFDLSDEDVEAFLVEFRAAREATT